MHAWQFAQALHLANAHGLDALRLHAAALQSYLSGRRTRDAGPVQGRRHRRHSVESAGTRQTGAALAGTVCPPTARARMISRKSSTHTPKPPTRAVVGTGNAACRQTRSAAVANCAGVAAPQTGHHRAHRRRFETRPSRRRRGGGGGEFVCGRNRVVGRTLRASRHRRFQLIPKNNPVPSHR